jgi:hypothetical protein
VPVAIKSLELLIARCVRSRISADLHDEAGIEPSSFTGISSRIAEHACLSDVVVTAVVKVAVYPEFRLRIEADAVRAMFVHYCWQSATS